MNPFIEAIQASLRLIADSPRPPENDVDSLASLKTFNLLMFFEVLGLPQWQGCGRRTGYVDSLPSLKSRYLRHSRSFLLCLARLAEQILSLFTRRRGYVDTFPSLKTFNKLYKQPKHKQPVIQAAQADATSYTSSASTSNQLYKQLKHRQPVIQAAQGQATSYTNSPSRGNQLYRLPKHRQPVMQAAQAQTTSYTSSPSTGNQL